MSGRRVQVFSDGDPLLAPYLAQYLQAQTCSLLDEGGLFYLGSSYFETLPLLSSSTEREQATKGLSAVLDLINPAFDALPASTKREACIQAVLCILNGALKLKYRKCGGLTRCKSVTPEVVERGTDYEINSAGQRVSTAYRVVPGRFALTAGTTYFRTADRKQPSLKKIWNIARNNAFVARSLYYYARSDTVGDVRSALEELMKETYGGAVPSHGRIPFNGWKTWAAPEVGTSEMDEFYAVLHNALLAGGDQVVHSMAFADIGQATRFKTSGTDMTLEEVREILHTLLMKWVTAKV